LLFSPSPWRSPLRHRRAPGFPVFLQWSGESSPALADLNGDGKLDVVIATADGRVHALDARGSELPGWPVTTDLDALHGGSAAFLSGAVSDQVHESVVSSVAVGDLQRSPFANLFGLEAINGRVYAIPHDGSSSPRVVGNPAGPYLPGCPVKIGIILDDLLPTVGHGVGQQAALGDLDGDCADERVRHR
jgi:hypothetical protein